MNSYLTMARRILLGGFLKSKFHRLPVPLLSSSSEKCCAAYFSTTRNIFASFDSEDDQQEQQSNNAKASTTSSVAEDRLRKFIDPKVQHLLRELTGLDYERVFRNRKVGHHNKLPTYTFMTESKLIEAIDKARQQTERLLQMPPVVPPRKPIDKVIAVNPELQGNPGWAGFPGGDGRNQTLLFTDITPNRTNRNRIIVAREATGTLRHATWDERDRMNQIYFPVHGKTVKIPKIFTNPEVLTQVFRRVETDPNDNVYEYICDRACLQFEPDDPLYISTVEAVYQRIDSLQHYNYLRFTRHYGPMVFHYVRFHKMDKLLLFYIKEERIAEAGHLVSLFHELFPEAVSAKDEEAKKNDKDKISKYIQSDAVLKSELTLLFNAYLEEERAKADLEKGLHIAHGVQ